MMQFRESYLNKMSAVEANYCRVYIGDCGTFTAVHTDPLDTSILQVAFFFSPVFVRSFVCDGSSLRCNWRAQLQGVKRVVLFAPGSWNLMRLVWQVWSRDDSPLLEHKSNEAMQRPCAPIAQWPTNQGLFRLLACWSS